MNGNKTKSHATFLYPAPHINDKIQVHNRTYNIFIMKIVVTDETSQLKVPKQYIFLFPKFWKNIIRMAILEITK
jgi:hypothetical protein